MLAPRLNSMQPIVDDKGRMSQVFRNFMLQLDREITLVGDGSPEGVIDANQFAFYINTAGTTGTILYCKMLPAIGGDTKQGWVLL